MVWWKLYKGPGKFNFFKGNTGYPSIFAGGHIPCTDYKISLFIPHSIVETIRKLLSGLLHFCSLDNLVYLEVVIFQDSRYDNCFGVFLELSAEVQKSSRKFSHGLDFNMWSGSQFILLLGSLGFDLKFVFAKSNLIYIPTFFLQAKRWLMLPWIVGTFLFLLAYLGGVIVSIYLIGTSRYEILLLLGFAIVEAAIGFYLWVCIVSLFQVNNSTAVRQRLLESSFS